MGLLDLPAPLLGSIDGMLSALPASLRLVLWGAVAGVATMYLYRAISPQDSIARSKRDQLALRKRLDDFDGELSEAWPLIRRLLRLSVGHLGRVLGPSLAASMPVLCLLVWVSTAYGYRFPASEPPLRVTPDHFQARWVNGGQRPPHVTLSERPGSGPATAEVTLQAPVTVVGRWRWWNVLFANPGGYLPAAGPVERLEIDLPERQYLDVGPSWMRGWEFPLFASLITVSLVMRRALRIE